MTGVGRILQDTIPKMRAFQTAAGASSHNRSASDQESPYLPLLCDVRIRDAVESVFKTSLDHWGKIDIVTNCSGYGVIGACEDQDDFEIRDQFEANFWGTLHILQLSLPYFRQRESGRYIIFSSTSGALGVPGLGPYCATKYAVEGLIESMLYETAAFNIRATLVEPGHVRRDDPQATLHSAEKIISTLPTFGHFFIKAASAPYDAPTAPAGHAKRMIQWLGEKQPTSAVKSAELVWQLGHCHFPPLRLLLGGFAVESVRDRLRGVTEEIEDWKFLSFKREEAETKEQNDDEDEEDDKNAALSVYKDEGDEEMEEDEEEDGDIMADIKMEHGSDDEH